MRCVKIIVSGKVQKVGYRKFTKKSADELDIKGFCRNLEDGTVEIFAKIDNEKLEAFIQKLKKGSLISRVDDIEINEAPEKDYENFDIIRY